MTAPAAPLDPGFAALEALDEAAAVETAGWLARMGALADLIAGTDGARHRSLAAEVGAALSVGERAAQVMLDTAWELRGVPRVREAVEVRRLTPRQCEVLLDELVGSSPETTDKVLDRLLAGTGGIWLRPERLRQAVRRQLVRIDPHAVTARRKKAEREESGVRYRSLPDGLAQKITTGPAALIQTAMRQLDRMTPPPASRADGDDRTTGQLMLATELGAIDDVAARVGLQPVPLDLELEMPVLSGAYRITKDNQLPEPVTIRLDLPALADLLTGTALHDPLLPTTDRSTRPSDSTQPDRDQPERDQPTNKPADRRAASARLARILTGCRARTSPVERQPQQVRPPITPQTTAPELTGHGPVDPALIAELLHHTLTTGAAVRLRRVLTDKVTGICAIDPHPGTLTGDLSGLTDLLTAPPPTPPPPTDAYRPTADQQRLVRARHPRCTFPGCRQPASHTRIRADLDHTTPWDPDQPDGGTTTVSNLAPLCRHHHQLKQTHWKVTRHRNGTTTWTSPTGRTYTNAPDERHE